eukprot:CAMPEP_0172922838 /NCGR_PEP_ID=MMETSP1075-20121228/208647_1 /TAXON_ID=2916 /ORGANISM="Ceratium fusus, Strain PA161109" /LENGTH=151 /DNA_ID=CAMNT_0013783211 /DNA_START=94 /DNA_END=546 /DNA_ORIENTATION=+
MRWTKAFYAAPLTSTHSASLSHQPFFLWSLQYPWPLALSDPLQQLWHFLQTQLASSTTVPQSGVACPPLALEGSAAGTQPRHGVARAPGPTLAEPRPQHASLDPFEAPQGGQLGVLVLAADTVEVGWCTMAIEEHQYVAECACSSLLHKEA